MNHNATNKSSQETYTRRVLTAVAIVGVSLLLGGLLWFLLPGLLVIFAGVLLGIFLYNLSARLADVAGLSYTWAFTLVVAGLLLLASLMLFFLGSQVALQASEFSDQFTKSVAQAEARLKQQSWWNWLNNNGQANQFIAPKQMIATARSTAMGTLWVFGSFVLIVFLGLYFGLQADLYHRGLVRLVRPGWRPRAEDVLRTISRKLWWWFLGRLVGMVLIGTGSAVGLWLLDVPLPFALGLIAGLMNFVPNLGPLIASVPALLFALPQGTQIVLYVAALYGLLQFVESYFITPLIDQQQVSIPPGLTLSAQLLLGMMGGVMGLLLATPLTVLLFTFVEEIYVKGILEGRS